MFGQYLQLNHVASNTIDAFGLLGNSIQLCDAQESVPKLLIEQWLADTSFKLRSQTFRPRHVIQALQYASVFSLAIFFILRPLMHRAGVLSDTNSVSLKLGKVLLINALFLALVIYNGLNVDRAKCQSFAEKFEDMSLYFERSFLDHFPDEIKEGKMSIMVKFPIEKPKVSSLFAAAKTHEMKPALFIRGLTLFRFEDKRLHSLNLEKPFASWSPHTEASHKIYRQSQLILFTREVA